MGLERWLHHRPTRFLRPRGHRRLDSFQLGSYHGGPAARIEAASSAEPDNDSVSNLAEFAFGLHPLR
jgi:hypothetical protein